MTDNQLIEKFINKELSEEEKQIFRNKYRDDSNFAENVNEHLNIIAALKTVSQHEGQPMPVPELETELSSEFIKDAINAIPDDVNRWIVSVCKVKKSQILEKWAELTEELQNIVQSFFINPQIKPVVEPYIPFSATKSYYNINVEPREDYVFEINTIKDIEIKLHLPKNETQYTGMYTISIYNRALKLIEKQEILVDADTLNDVFENQEEQIKLNFDAGMLKPALYYLSVEKDGEMIVEYSRFFVIS